MARSAFAGITGLVLGMSFHAWHMHGGNIVLSAWQPHATDWDSLFSGGWQLVTYVVTGGYKQLKCVCVFAGHYLTTTDSLQPAASSGF